MRDHRSLIAFQLADALVFEVHRCAQAFPAHERFILGSQLRKASLSTASNIVEGCARNTPGDFLHFLDIALGSAREVEYQLTVAHRLGYPVPPDLLASSSEVCRTLRGLIHSLRP